MKDNLMLCFMFYTVVFVAFGTGLLFAKYIPSTIDYWYVFFMIVPLIIIFLIMIIDYKVMFGIFEEKR